MGKLDGKIGLDLDRLFVRIGQAKGKLDVVFANAAVAESARFGKITEEH